jgi:peroxiredoxin
MKKKLLVAMVLAGLALSGLDAIAQEKSKAATELGELVGKVQKKIQAKQTTEAELSDELKQFDQLLADHKAEKTDDVAQILVMKAMLYREIIKDETKSDALMTQLQKDFPDTKIAKGMLAQEEGRKVNAKLVVGTKFPDFEVKDVAGNPLSLAKYKGKVVLLDFWATWCPPCVGEVPDIVKAYEKHHDQGFEIIGISLDREEKELAKFTKDKNMTWPQFFDGQGKPDSLAQKYGIMSIPSAYLLDGEGTIIAKGLDLRGEKLEPAISKALTKS